MEKGPNDLEEQIGQLTKQKEFLQRALRKAAQSLAKLEADKALLTRDVDRLSEERDNLLTLLGGRENGNTKT